MMGSSHRLVNFTLVGAATCSLSAALCAMLGSAFPDSSEWLLWGRARNRHHRRLTHWFVPWLALALLCLHRGGGRAPNLAGLAAGAGQDLWACAGFWCVGCLLHILLDACCGFRVIIMTVANSSVKSRVLKLLPKLKTEETDGLCVA